ncbi:aminotransferase class I/II-fold pyridoxal phosphate-dependent enzyme [Streptomyces triticirhizae]|uniref:Aminotransferase class I/II-fold pyridoxal phosphate-dependent enzyme n=1 Tax=Streptomyces triticirhizae TaxID=2483353 RepID=A0A3M2M183_9ACTN|nr:aminotransferase class I/II-fold pyridoxal phosphate-dependent enzyme [Streptomyces triticirhizae]RMI43391.1 aminotransferase class I/II-fold pyridoxal phosphate-dependent enzyme [Streptomyces triticirhizae]
MTAPTRPVRPGRALRPRTAADYHRAARERLPENVWDFVQGGAGEERTLRANTEAFDRTTLRPRVLTGTATCDTSVEVLGGTWAAPFAVAPMAYHGLCHPEGERATVAAAGALGLPMVVSCMAGVAVGELRALTPAPLWFQLYVFRDRHVTRELVRRAEAAGCDALVVTVDTPRLGRRHRDAANDFRVPPTLRPVNLPEAAGTADPGGHARAAFRPGLDWSVVAELRRTTRLPLVVKGVLTGEDTELAARHGADAVIVSNHGGRQLDGAPAALDVLPEAVAAAAGRLPVLMDGGVRRGRDVATALALGGAGVLVGRPVLEALAVGGEHGVRDLLGLLCAEFEDTLLLSGQPRAADLDVSLLTPPARPPTAAPSAPARAAAGETGEVGKVGEVGEVGEKVIAVDDLHGSLRDPVLGTMSFLNEITLRHPEAISFAPGRPRTEPLDSEQVIADVRRWLADLSARVGPQEAQRTLLQYGPSAGLVRDHVARLLRTEEDTAVDPASVVVTNGLQEALFLTLRALFGSPDDVLMLPEPCYVGATGAARLLDLRVAAVPDGDPAGLPERVAAVALAQRARGLRPVACYVVPDAANPRGTTLDAATRARLLATAADVDLLLLEDTPYRPFTLAPPQPTLKSLDRARRVVRLGSFAKSAFPGARLGFAVADQWVAEATGRHLLADDLAALKGMVTLNTSTLSQAAVAGLLLRSGHDLHRANDAQRAGYHATLHRVLATLERLFPPVERKRLGVSWTRPDGGFFLALTVPFPADDALLARSAGDYGVLWTPMRYFAVGARGAGERTCFDHVLRLSFSELSPDRAEEGLTRLARLVSDRHAEIHGPAGPATTPERPASPAGEGVVSRA